MLASNVPMAPRRAAVLLLVAALHALVLLTWLRQRANDGTPDREQGRITVQLLPSQQPPAAATQPNDPSSRARGVARTQHPPTRDARAAVPAATQADAREVSPSTNPAPVAESPIDLDASMRAVAREMGRGGTVTIDAQAASAPGLGEAIAASSAPDCRTAYRSLGLLALPVLAWNALRDRCR